MATASDYQNPLRDIVGLRPERIDQGVDYGGTGPIYPIGNAIIENVVGKGWPGGTFIEYRLTSGPYAGQHIYAAEDIVPSVHVGQTVDPTTPLGTVFAGGSGIETGWADPNVAAQRAAGRAQFTGSNATAYGANFSSFLQSLGAPGGTGGQNPTGAVPAELTAFIPGTNIHIPGTGSGANLLPNISAGGLAGDLISPFFAPFGSVKNAILLGAQAIAGVVFIVLGIVIILVDTKAAKGPIPIPVPV